MFDRSNRTFICSVVFLDIAEYSKRPVAEQIRLRDRFNTVLAEAIRDVPVNDRIILDTGDGAALSFLGTPEEALFVAMAIRDATAQPVPGDFAPLPVRLGINLGPVRLIKDFNGQPNIIGDGINVAQRVMSFAQPGQILVSRSYYDVVACLSDDYAQLFRYEGSRTDKHVRAHDIYAVGYSPASLSALRAAPRSREVPAPPPALRVSRREWVLLGTLAATIVASGVVLRIQKKITEERPAPPSQAAAPAAPKAKPRSAEAPPPAATAARPEAEERRQPKPLPKERKTEPQEQAAAAGAGHVILAILPWGEVYVDGKLQGVSPPLRALDLKPGRHVIEIRNTSFPVYTEVVDLRAEERIRVRHQFR